MRKYKDKCWKFKDKEGFIENAGLSRSIVYFKVGLPGSK